MTNVPSRWFFALALGAMATPALAQVVTEFSAGISAHAGPFDIVAGSDGNLWFTEQYAAKLGRITLTGGVSEFLIAANSFPEKIALGPDGNVWFTEAIGGQIGRISPSGTVAEFNSGITQSISPYGLVTGSDGNIWFTGINGNQIGRITPKGVATSFTEGISPEASPSVITAGPDGNLWFTEESADKIGRITTAGVITEFGGLSRGSAPLGMVAGADGSLWFTETGADRIGRITTQGVITEFAVSPGSGPFAITNGPDGNLWFTEYSAARVGRITLAGVVTEFSAGISPGSFPGGIITGPDGNVWFTELVGNRIGRITFIKPPLVALAVNAEAKGVNQAIKFTVSLTNTNNVAATLTSDFIFKLPDNFELAIHDVGEPFATCRTDLLNAYEGSSYVTLIAGSVIGPNTSCEIVLQAVGTVAGTYTAAIPAGTLTTNFGSNLASNTVPLAITGIVLNATARFVPSSIQPGDQTLLTVTLANPNPAQAMSLFGLSIPLPSSLQFVGQATSTCSQSAAYAISADYSLPSLDITGPAILPANGSCTYSATVTTSKPGFYTGLFDVGSIVGDIAGFSGAGDFFLQVGTYTPSYVGRPPSRILDTRADAQTEDSQFAGGGRLAAASTLDVPVLGRGGVPSSGVAAVAINLTAVNPSGTGYVTAWPTGGAKPLSSNLNFTPGSTVPNLVTVPVGENGKVSIFNSAGNTDFVADVVGYFLSNSPVEITSPMRFLDSRLDGKTFDQMFAATGPLLGDKTFDLNISNRGFSFYSGLESVLMNLTVTNPTKSGFITAFASGIPRPATSNLNYLPGQTVANLVLAQVGTNGNVSIYNSAGSVDLIADVVGWAPPDSQLHVITPVRMADTRRLDNAPYEQFFGGGALTAGSHADVQIAGRGIPQSDVEAVVLNVTATNATTAGYLSVWSEGSVQPLASNLNFAAGVTVANLVIVRLGHANVISIFNSAGNTDVIVDVVGWFSTVPFTAPAVQ